MVALPTSPPKRSRAVLIVEDEPVIAFGIEELLIDAGFAIAGVAVRLEEALAIIESGICGAAILDANLAGVSAAPAARALTERGVPFLVLSGYARNQQAPALLEAALHLHKPCPPERLIQALRCILPAQESVPEVPRSETERPLP